ncbi:hypothetical protein [Actinocorallia libanotica]|uniref:Uncharacterized protein n=1 Tax=Actinocorallia libanotica TaxID=46162 RepID=A0ABN1RW66_9ACTN
MTGTRSPRALAALVLVSLFLWPAPAAADPGASASPAGGAPGTAVQVRGAGWPAGVSVQISVCGRNAVNGSVDCDQPNAVAAPVGPDGIVTAGLTVSAPPVPCPCVIHITTPAGAERMTVDVPFSVLGHETADVVKQENPARIDVVDAELRGSGGVSELFGWRTRRTLVLTVRNNGPDPVTDAPLVVGWGADATADSPLTAPPTGTIDPGATAVYRVPVELPPASYGTFVVGGRFAGQTEFQLKFTTYPYLLFAVNLIALLAVLAGVRAALRRRRTRSRGAAGNALSPAAPKAAPRPLDQTALLTYLEGSARQEDGETLVIDRPSLVAYLNGPPLVDPRALDRFLSDGGPDASR